MTMIITGIIIAGDNDKKLTKIPLD